MSRDLPVVGSFDHYFVVIISFIECSPVIDFFQDHIVDVHYDFIGFIAFTIDIF